jgi:hypothetical protein
MVQLIDITDGNRYTDATSCKNQFDITDHEFKQAIGEYSDKIEYIECKIQVIKPIKTCNKFTIDDKEYLVVKNTLYSIDTYVVINISDSTTEFSFNPDLVQTQENLIKLIKENENH